ncbi:terpenoid synthase [Panus rudis PR-1116 ss-1]|nr:terpenoid synthase [Panus rudis PR-1116 ss-1]
MEKVALPREEKFKVEDTVRSTVYGWQLPSPAKFEPYIVAGIDYAHYCLPYTPPDFQVLVALYSVCTISCDDSLVTPFERQTFVEQLYAGQPQWHPLLSRLLEVATKLREHFSVFGGNAICSGTLEYLNAMNLDAIDSEQRARAQSGAAKSMDYLRCKDGTCEPYALFVWPQSLFPDFLHSLRAILDAMTVIALVNDLLSFHKEEQSGETNNYVHQYSRAHTKSIPEALRCITDEMVGCVNEVRRLLGAGPERDAWDAYVLGYVRFHIYTPLYKLEDIVPEFFCGPTEAS